MSSFFTTSASQKKRKRSDAPPPSSKRRTISSTKARDSGTQSKPSIQDREDSISGSDSGDSDNDVRARHDLEEEDASSSGEEDETADDRRLRLAQRYLDNIKEEVAENPDAFDAAEIDRDLIADRLKEDVAETKGRLYRKLVAELDFPTADHTYFSSDQDGVTAVATSFPYAFTVSKDSSITKWELATPTTSTPGSNIAPRKRPKLLKRFKLRYKPGKSYNGHSGAILCIAVSSSGKFLATGGVDKRLVIWDAATLKPIKSFPQHRDSVLSVSFRRGTHTLFSASADRTIKIWSLDEMAYIETLFGHQDNVVGVAGLSQEKCISVGARDRTARLWKVVEESQLVFRGGGSTATRTNRDDKSTIMGQQCAEGSIDRVAMIDEEIFVTGSDNGSINLWNINRKKPVFTIHLAHGLDPALTPKEAYAEENPRKDVPGRPVPRWITALTTVPLSDLVLSGSWDGHVRAWKISEDRRRLERVGIVGHLEVDGSESTIKDGDVEEEESEEVPDEHKTVRGVVNDISVFERGEKGKDGLCIVAAVSKEHRLAKWKKLKGRNGAVVFEVSRKVLENGHSNGLLENGVAG
jgi:ribosomal RNA-processing protein 9